MDEFNVSDQLGSGGTGLAPTGSGPSNGLPVLRDLLRSLFGAVFTPYASTAAMQASLAKNRADGQLVVRLSDYSLWCFEAGSSAAAGATVIKPTDVGSGTGRFTEVATSPATLAGLAIQTGSGTCTAGVSNTIAATITAGSKIVVTRKDLALSSAIGVLSAETADRVVGAPGSFIVRSLRPATMAAETGDASTFDWYVIG
jgi:hypothetical protein